MEIQDVVSYAFKGAGLCAAVGVAVVAEAGTLLTLKVLNSVDMDNENFRTMQQIGRIALMALALGSALIVSAGISASGAFLVSGMADLVFTAENADLFCKVFALAIAAYTFYRHYCAFQWACTKPSEAIKT